MVARKLVDWKRWWLVVKIKKHSYKWQLITYDHTLCSCKMQDFFYCKEFSTSFQAPTLLPNPYPFCDSIVGSLILSFGYSYL
jgi:hypothetical protein